MTNAIDEIEISMIFRSSRPDMFLGKGVPETWSKFVGEHPCRNGI